MSTANVVDEVAKEFGFTLKEKQKEVISAFISGNDVFCCLPSRYGKSLAIPFYQRFMIVFVMLKGYQLYYVYHH